MSAPAPTGYLRISVGRRSVVTREEHHADARAMLADGTLYEFASRDATARPLAGRGVAYAIALPASGTEAVVRHNRHGGLLAPLTRDLFLAPTRAPYELSMSLRLAEVGVRTPPVLMYGIESCGALLRRADVMTRAVADSRDLATYMQPGEPAATRAEAWAATRILVDALGDAGARHHDLNVKNLLLARCDGVLQAWVLDVDRVVFTSTHDARTGNAARLLRSARKWRSERGAEFEEGEL